ncbi:MAG: GHKL domain-containing protein [Prevotellaceae bacterium]|jgi:nitrogen fixation/metabolism regulation signal transduction histidine kinase|nr:GHKL domain-containing protein [Prevotellaceae bacterium]
MFKSVQYNLYIYTALLTVSVSAASICVFTGHRIFAVAGIFVIFVCLLNMNRCYRRYSQNILFMLNALENGDASFRFSGAKLSVRERELNVVMNRIKDILANARKEVIENEHFLSIILESVSTGVVIFDDAGIVHKVNRGALNMLGLPVFTHVNQLHAIREDCPQLFLSLRPGDRLQIALATEREEMQISLSAAHIRLKRGMMRIVTMNNIGNELEMKEMESWIRLIRVMTHEIMNSIAPIVSLSETMRFLYRAGEESQKLRHNTLEAFETIHSTASGLIKFVESYRKFASVPKPEKRIFDLRVLVEKIFRLHETLLMEKNITLDVCVPETFSIFADENLIAQVIINLLKNAVEAIDADTDGKIAFSAQYTDENRIYIDIANNGKPISRDVLPHIFVPFFTTKADGSGVGLSISRYIMRLHGGALQHFVSSNGMTVFRIRIDM